MKSVLIVFIALLLTMSTGIIFHVIDNTVTEDYTITTAGVTTPPGQYASNVTLTIALWNNSVPTIKLASTSDSDVPSAASYNSLSKRLEVYGLSDNTTRTLTVQYKINSSTLDAGLALFLPWMKWFWILVDIGTVIGAIWAFFHT